MIFQKNKKEKVYMQATIQNLINTVTSFIAAGASNILLAAVVFFIGYKIINKSMGLVRKGLSRAHVESTLHPFIVSVTRITLIVFLGISCLDLSGLVKTTSIITALGAVGLAVSLAFQDSLSNLAGGLMMLFTKPFTVGDYLNACDEEGTITEIGTVYTTLNTIDNKKIFIPNGDIVKSKIVNYSAEPRRRLDLTFGIGYSDDFQRAKAIILEVAERSGMVSNDPQPPFARVSEHGASSVNIATRLWVNKDHYWDLKFYMMEEVKLAFDKEGISIPFNQLDVHLIK